MKSLYRLHLQQMQRLKFLQNRNSCCNSVSKETETIKPVAKTNYSTTKTSATIAATTGSETFAAEKMKIRSPQKQAI